MIEPKKITTYTELITTSQKLLSNNEFSPPLYRCYINTLLTITKKTKHQIYSIPSTPPTPPILTNPTILSLLQHFFKHPQITLSNTLITAFMRQSNGINILTTYINAHKIFDIKQTNTIFNLLNYPHLHIPIYTFITNNPQSFTLSRTSIETAFQHQLLQLITTLIDKKTQFTPQCLYNTIINNNLTLCKTLLLLGLTFDIHSLELACSRPNLEIIQFILSTNPSIIPTTECFNNICSTANPSRKTTSQTHNIQTAAISLLTTSFPNIYHLTYDDIVLATKSHILIKSDLTSITFDPNYPNICLQSNFFPDYLHNAPISLNFLTTITQWTKYAPIIKKILNNGLQPDLHTLHLACKCHTPTTIELFAQKGNFQLDIQCFQIACTEYNIPLVNHLIKKHNHIPLASYFKTIGNNNNLTKFDKLLHTCSITPNMTYMDQACSTDDHALVDYLITTHHIIPDINCLRKACTNGSGRTIRYIIKQNIAQFDIECLQLICSMPIYNKIGFSGHTDIISSLCTTHKISPNIECLKEAITKLDPEIAIFLIENYISPDIECLKAACNDGYSSNYMLNLLVTKYNIIPNLECLEIACKTKDTKIIQLLIAKGKIKPDQTCLRAAQKNCNKSVTKFVETLVESS